MNGPMPDKVLRQRFKAVANRAVEPLVRQYMEESCRCFVVGAFNGAVVMMWNAAACYLRQVVRTIGITFFQHNYRVLYDQNPPDELLRINDGHFMEVCKRSGLLRDVVSALDRLRDRRNECAHPSGLFVSASEALELAESISNVISCRFEDVCLTDPAILKEFARTTTEQDGETIAQWVQNDLCQQLAHDLLTIFERDTDVKNASGIIGLWRGLWNRVDEVTQQRLWNRIERIVQNTLSDLDNALRTPEELVRLIVWPDPNAEYPPRDRISELFITWLEGLARSGQFRSVDMDLARGLRQYLPPSLHERLQAALQEMARRYVE
jgi:hypothetical protein